MHFPNNISLRVVVIPHSTCVVIRRCILKWFPNLLESNNMRLHGTNQLESSCFNWSHIPLQDCEVQSVFLCFINKTSWGLFNPQWQCLISRRSLLWLHYHLLTNRGESYLYYSLFFDRATWGSACGALGNLPLMSCSDMLIIGAGKESLMVGWSTSAETPLFKYHSCCKKLICLKKRWISSGFLIVWVSWGWSRRNRLWTRWNIWGMWDT
jgi:hypothetical protein